MNELLLVLFVSLAYLGMHLDSKASKYYFGKPIHRLLQVHIFFPENFSPEGKHYYRKMVLNHVACFVVFILICINMGSN